MIQTQTKHTQMAGDGMERPSRRCLRRQPPPFSILNEPAAGFRFSEESMGIARSRMIVLGEWTPAVDQYLQALSYAPACYLRTLGKRGRNCAIMIAPSVADAYLSSEAEQRREESYSEFERSWIGREYGRASDVVAVYEPDFDALILPTIARFHDYERLVLHELGHALTYRELGEAPRPDLMHGLPDEIAEHVGKPAYSSDPFAQVSEVMAEAFVWTVLGRGEELPSAVISELVGILPLDVDPRLDLL